MAHVCAGNDRDGVKPSGHWGAPRSTRGARSTKDAAAKKAGMLMMPPRTDPTRDQGVCTPFGLICGSWFHPLHSISTSVMNRYDTRSTGSCEEPKGADRQ